MKKVIRLSESKLREIIKKVISEQETIDTTTTVQPLKPLPKDTKDTFWGEAVSIDAGIATQMATAIARQKFKGKYFDRHQKMPDKSSFEVASKDVVKINNNEFRAIVGIKEKTF